MFSVPPRRLAASLVSENGARATSNRRRSERSRHSGERACSTSDSCVTTPRIVSMVAAPAVGMERGVGEQLLHLAGDADGQPEPADEEVANGLRGRR